jgi:MFS family permease
LSLIAGVIVDRMPRRPLLIAAQLVRGAALLSLPLSWTLHALSLVQVYVVTLIIGVAGAFAETASVVFLRAVSRERCGDATTNMSLASASAETVGASLAGLAITAVGAPLAIAIDAVSAAVSTLCLARIRCADEPLTRTRATAAALRRDLFGGARLLFGDPVLRTIGIANATSHFGGAMVMSVFAIFLYRELHLSALSVGLVLGAANLSIGGALVARRMVHGFGLRRTLTLAILAAGCANMLLAFAQPIGPVITLVTVRLVVTFCGPIVAVNEQAVRMARVPAQLVGRVTAANRTLVWGMLPLGALGGGYLGQLVGSLQTILIGGVISLAAAAVMSRCPAFDQTRVGDGHRLPIAA